MSLLIRAEYFPYIATCTLYITTALLYWSNCGTVLSLESTLSKADASTAAKQAEEIAGSSLFVAL